MRLMDEHEGSRSPATVDRSEGFGERLLDSLIDRAHQMAPAANRRIDRGQSLPD